MKIGRSVTSLPQRNARKTYENGSKLKYQHLIDKAKKVSNTDHPYVPIVCENPRETSTLYQTLLGYHVRYDRRIKVARRGNTVFLYWLDSSKD